MVAYVSGWSMEAERPARMERGPSSASASAGESNSMREETMTGRTRGRRDLSSKRGDGETSVFSSVEDFMRSIEGARNAFTLCLGTVRNAMHEDRASTAISRDSEASMTSVRAKI